MYVAVHDVPVRVVILVDGKMEKMDQNKCNTWTTDILKYRKFEDFLCKCSSKHNPEVQLVFILDFPVVGERCMVQHMYKLLNTREMSDVTFVVKGEKINAHKNILVAASSVMAAVFNGENFKEGQSNTVEIEDIDHKVFEQLLHYIYTGTAPLLHEESMTEPLFSAANKYQIEGLKEICVDSLITKLKLRNAVHFLVVGNLHSATKLEKASLRVLTKYRDVVWDRPEWKKFMESNQDLFFQTCAQMFSKPKT
jgi:speckle-type POZ protein